MLFSHLLWPTVLWSKTHGNLITAVYGRFYVAVERSLSCRWVTHLLELH